MPDDLLLRHDRRRDGGAAGRNSPVNLDVPTLMAMGSFVNTCAGIVLLIAWWQNRTTVSLALWGISEVLIGFGIFCLALGDVFRHVIWLIIGGSLLALGPGLMWRAARQLDAKPAPILFALIGVAAVATTKSILGSRDIAMALSLAAGALYTLAAAVTLWGGRGERLPARWPLIALMAVHATVLLIGVATVLSGGIPQASAPPVMSPFGVIHFEANIFAIGTAVFVLALIKERKEAASRLAANIDGLTGIANRAAFLQKAGKIIERCLHERAPVSVIMFDLDLFKGINDRYGHGVGDDVLRKFCEVAGRVLRPNDAFGRLGGEEFAVVLPGCIEAAHARAERIRTTFAEECRSLQERELHATVSGGVSTSEYADHSLRSLLDEADLALYHAKAMGRNRIEQARRPLNEARSSNVLYVA